MIKLCQVVLSQKLLKTDMLEIKLSEDLNFCSIIKFGINNSKEIIGEKSRWDKKICFMIHIFTGNKFLKRKNRCKFCLSSYHCNRSLYNPFALVQAVRRGWKIWEKCSFFKWDIFSRQSDIKFFFDKLYYLLYKDWIYVIS